MMHELGTIDTSDIQHCQEFKVFSSLRSLLNS
jgi:hypothetical protein